MKILYVITGLGQGGAERVVCDLADEMFKKGHEVKIAYLTGDIVFRPEYQEIELIKINLNDVRTLLTAYIRLAKVIKKFRPDVVHSHMVHANILTRLVRLATPMDKLISTAHNSNEGGTLRMLGYRVTHRLADLSTNVSQEATQAFKDMGAVPNNGMLTVYNGISLEKFKNIPEARARLEKELNLNRDCKIILTVGRFNEQKDYPNLLHAINLLKKEVNYPFKVIIAGDGELRELIEKKVNNLGLHDNITLLGRRNDIPELMSAADLFVLSSKYEGFGLVIAEAIACECLVVATDCGGVAEVLNNPDFLVLPEDPVALKKKIKQVLDLSYSKKQNVISKNIRWVRENFSLEEIIKKWNFLYNE